MVENPTHCPKCRTENIYFDGSSLWICIDCSHEWIPSNEATDTTSFVDETTIKDAHGQVLQDGDSVTVIKELRIKGSSSTVKVGTKVKNIRLIDSADGHNIACKIDGLGAINLKSEFVKKA